MRRQVRSIAEIEADLERLPRADDGSMSSDTLDYLDDTDTSDDNDRYADRESLIFDNQDDDNDHTMGMRSLGEPDNGDDRQHPPLGLAQVQPGFVSNVSAAAHAHAAPHQDHFLPPFAGGQLAHQLRHAADGNVNIDVNNTIDNDAHTIFASRKRKSRDENENIDMTITDEERRWALELKAAVLESSKEDYGSDKISDMEYAQHAIIANGNIQEALTRMSRLNEFRKQYEIQDTVEHGIQSIQAFLKQHPGFLLNLDQCSRHGYFVQVIDFAQFHPKKIRLPNQWKTFLRGFYYIQTSLHPTLAGVRKGILAIAECDGMGWDNFCLDFERRFWYEHVHSYPFKFHEISMVRTPLAANVAFSLVKPIMSENARQVLHMGVKFDESFDGRLDELFLQPAREIAETRIIETARALLTCRYANEGSFKLSSS